MPKRKIPKTGCWIQWEGSCGPVKVTGCEDPYGIPGFDDEIVITFEYPDGGDDFEDLDVIRKGRWKYVEAPAPKMLKEKELERQNISRGIECGMCKTTSKELFRCTACKKVWYCGKSCQKADWKAKHKLECKELNKKKIPLPNPRYPLKNRDLETCRNQIITQKRIRRIVQEALSGNFKIAVWNRSQDKDGGHYDDDDWILNPTSYDLEPLEKYVVRLDFDPGYKSGVFKWRGLETSEHSPKGPASCGLYEYLQILPSEITRGGLHTLFSISRPNAPDECLFWGMVINFGTFGTVAPFEAGCYCKFGGIPVEWETLAEKWDDIFKCAKENPRDVQCMYSSTDEGCHNFENCKFRHYLIE